MAEVDDEAAVAAEAAAFATEGSARTFRLYAKGFRAGESQPGPDGGTSNYPVVVK